MNCTTVRLFVDTNVLVYLFDGSSPEKRRRAKEIVKREGPLGNLVLSTQVLQEFYVSVTRKLEQPLPADAALEATKALAEWSIVRIDPAFVFAAIELSIEKQLSFWDALIVRAAIESRCDRLLTEDLQDGMEIDGVRIDNPFGN